MAEQKVVVFKLENEFYGLPIERVERILPEQSITKVPRAPELLLGMFEVRGSTLPAISLRRRFGRVDPEGSTNMIVVHLDEGPCAMQVDAVDGIIALEPGDVEEAHVLMKSHDDGFVNGVAKSAGRLILLLNVDQLVPTAVRNHLEKFSA